MYGIYDPSNQNEQQGSKLTKASNSSINDESLDLIDEYTYDFIPTQVYDHLPKILKETTEIFTERREKDIFLTGALSAFGGCFHNVYAYNTIDKTKLSPNIFSFIVAPPASGKNVLMYAAKLIDRISITFKDNSFLPSKGLIIPGNNTSAGMIEFLKENTGIGVIIEPEIDTMVNAHKQEWGDYSDLLRVSFENSPYRYYRKTKKEFIEINPVKLSLAISGTPQQFINFIKTPENGLFSRGCYYVFDDKRENIRCFGRLTSEKPITESFEEFADNANNDYKRLVEHEEILINFNYEQLQQIQDVIQEELEYINLKEAEANVLRAFMVIQKIATTLTILDLEGSFTSSHNCKDEILEAAINLTITYLRHSYKALELLDKKGTQAKSKFNLTELRVIRLLPDSFSRAEAIESCKLLDCSDKTIDNTIKSLIDKEVIEIVKRGYFKKVKTSNEDENDWL